VTELKTRLFQFQRDYPELCEWWRAREAQGWRYIPSSALPKIGIVVEDSEHKYCVCFVYLCESNWAWLEWVTTNPASPLRRRREALELLLRTARDAWQRAGCQNVVSSLNNENLMELYEGIGFRRGQGGMTDMIWRADS
jgi:hypothetical protein